jgi:hypothetical protein
MFQKLKSTKFLSKAIVFSSYLWLVCVLLFVYIIFASTKGFSHDPCYGAGCPENFFLIPMLASLFLGFFFFGLMILCGVIRIFLKAEKWKPPLNLGSWKVGIAAFLILVLVGVYMIGTLRSFVGWGGSYTGQDLFSAVNSHRQSKGLSILKTGEGLCDNLVSRWKSVKDGKQHEGFEDWVKNEGIQTNFGYKQVVELYIQTSTPAEAISFWESSPGHEIELDNPRWTEGCAYANEGTGVLIMSYK